MRAIPLLGLLLVSCLNPASIPETREKIVTPAAPVIVVPALPAGCDQSLTGQWLHSGDAHFVYSLSDDGGTVTLLVTREDLVDAGPDFAHFRRDAGPVPVVPTPAPKKNRKGDAGVTDAGLDAGSADAGLPGPLAEGELLRGMGLTGTMHSAITLPSGRVCDVQFGIRVTSCGDAGLAIETQSIQLVNASCEVPDAGSAWTPQLLKRR